MKKPTIKATVMGVATAALAFAASSANAEEIKVYNWAEYLGETTIEDFTKETGIDVVFDTYDSVETVDAKLLAGKTGYDVVDHASSTAAKLIAAGGILQEIDKSKISNYGSLNKTVMAKLEDWDPGNKYFVPYTYGTNGVTTVPAWVKEVHPDAPSNLDLIFKPEHMEKISKCGVAFLDSPEDIIPMALGYLGLDPNSTKKKDYAAAADLLNAVRPFIKTFDNYAYTRLAEKEFCVMVTWGPDGLYAADVAEEAGLEFDVEFFSQEGASNFWVDSWMIPADAANVDGAHKWLDFMTKPQNAANATNYHYYATAVDNANELVESYITESPATYPSLDSIPNLVTLKTIPQKAARVRTRTWTKFKAGN